MDLTNIKFYKLANIKNLEDIIQDITGDLGKAKEMLKDEKFKNDIMFALGSENDIQSYAEIEEIIENFKK